MATTRLILVTLQRPIKPLDRGPALPLNLATTEPRGTRTGVRAVVAVRGKAAGTGPSLAGDSRSQRTIAFPSVVVELGDSSGKVRWKVGLPPEQLEKGVVVRDAGSIKLEGLQDGRERCRELSRQLRCGAGRAR